MLAELIGLLVVPPRDLSKRDAGWEVEIDAKEQTDKQLSTAH